MSLMFRHKWRTFRQSLALLLAICLAAYPAGYFAPQKAEAAAGDTITYSFPALTSDPENPRWKVTASKPEVMRLTPTSFQVINNASTPEVNGEFLSIGFYIDESGYYDLAIQSWENAAGGIVDILVDGQVLKSDFSFYSATQTAKTIKPLASNVRLDKGMHTLTFNAKQTVRLPSNGRYYLYLYLEDFRLTVKEIFNELNEVTLTADETYLNPVAEQMLVLTGKMAGGAPADLTSAQIEYTSSNPNVLTVTPTGVGTAKVTAVAPGRAYVKASVTLAGVTRESIVEFNVGVQPETVVYDFKLPVNSKLSDGGWELGERTVGNITSQPYGMLVAANKVGDYVTYRILVPQDGYYETRFNGGASAGGATVSATIDGNEVGTYSFYLGSTNNSKGFANMRTVYLSAGVHEFRLTVTGRYQLANNWSVMPSQLQLVRKAGLPTLQGLSLEVSRPELMVGQTAKIVPRGTMADGFTYDMIRTSPSSVTLSVYDPAVASLTPDGVLRALQPGETTVTAQVYVDGIGFGATQTVVVNTKTLETVTLTIDKPKVSLGMTAQLTVTGQTYGQPVDLSDATIVFRSLNPSVATVDEKGTVTAVGLGVAELQAEVTLGPSTKIGSVQVEVTPPYLNELTVTMYRPKTFVGETRRLDLWGVLNNGQPADLSQATITYTSSNPQVVQVDDSGNLHILAPGTSVVSVSVSLGGVTKTGQVTVEAQQLTSAKTRATIYTDEKVGNARRNAETYDWAKATRDAAVQRAEQFLAKGADFLWTMVPAQTLPRSIYVNQTLGSPITGREIDKFGNYPYLGDPINEPFKIVDPSSGYKFPTNDFLSYYLSGLDEHGFFDPKRADRSLLVNTLYPEKGPTWGVDDGFGWVDEYGNRYTFIAYYVHWFLWYGSSTALLQSALNAFRDAYIYTGDPKYAVHGIILLDRIADVYPDLDISKYDPNTYFNSHGGTNTGKAIGKIWETSLVKDFVAAYDAFFPAFDDPAVMNEVLDFLGKKADQFDLPLKRSATGIRRNIEDGIIKQVYPGVKNAQIHGNNGFHQSALAMAAVVYDTLPETKEWLDFNFLAGGLLSGPWRVTGGNIGPIMVNDVDRDGAGNEAAPEYIRYWLSTFEQVADVLDGYDKYPEADLYRNVKFRKMYSSVYPLMLSEMYIPQIGDSGQTGNPGLLGLSKTQFIKAYEKFRDPVFAQLAYFMNNNNIDGIHGDIFSADPEQIARDIEQVIETYGPLDLKSDNLTGYGFAALRDGESVKFNFGHTYLFTQMPIAESTQAYKIFDNITTLQFEAAGVGDSITFEFDVPKTDTYEISLKPYRTVSFGKYRISIDEQPLSEFDFYGFVSEHETIGTLALTEGKHRITFEVIGKDGDSSGYKMGVSQLALLDESERERRDATYNSTLRDVWVYYGRNTGHGHKDTLNLGMHAYGLDLLPDLGYPEYADATSGHRHEWVNNTISHNTVMVNKHKQGDQWVATPKLFDDGNLVKLVDVEAPDVYPETSLYKRTTAMIRVDDENSYAVDFFRVKGGHDHHFSFHAMGETVTTEGLNLVAQPTGTYAGPDVEFEQRPAGDSAPGYGYNGPGFHFLKNVERDDDPGSQFSVDWQIKDYYGVRKDDADIHLRLTMLNDVDDVALADGVPPRNKPGNPPSLRYLIAHRQGTNLDSLFTSVIEPYKDERYIESIEQVPVTMDGEPADQDVRAVKVTLKNGRTDYIVSALNPDVTYTVDGKFTFKGAFGVYSEKNGVQVYGYVMQGSQIGDTTADTPSLHGTVVDFTRDLSIENEITVDFGESLDNAESLIGRYLYVANDGVRNAAYRIRGVKAQDGSRVTFDIGDVTTVRSYVDVNDFSKGFVYDIAPGQAVTIPLSAEKIETELRLSGRPEMWRGDTQTLKAELVFPDNRRQPLTEGVQFSSSNPEVATVNEHGVVTALKPGTAVITAQYEGQQASLEITVKEPLLEGLEIVGEPEMTAGRTQTLQVFALYSNGNKIELESGYTLTSSEHSIVKVEKDGSIRAIREGESVITATYENVSRTFLVRVHKREPGEGNGKGKGNK